MSDLSPAPSTAREGARGVTYGLEERDSTMGRHMVLIDAMIAWQISNPGKPWRAGAQALGLSPQWCRMVASTDAYKARMSEQSDNIIREVGLMGLKEKIAAATEVAIDRLAEKLEMAESLGDITDATEVLLQAHFNATGGGMPSAPATVNVNTQVILQARQDIYDGPRPPAPAQIEEPPK